MRSEEAPASGEMSEGSLGGLALPITGGGMPGKGELRRRAPGGRCNSGGSSCT
jgi:hypothetical protein